MNGTRWLLPAAALLCVSCVTATSGPYRHTSAAPPPVDPKRAAFTRELEAAYKGMVARETNPRSGLRADLEAATSIPIPAHRSIDGAVEYFAGTLREKIQASLLRSARYRTLIDLVLEEHRLPKALAYLPVIESAYIPTLTSRAGAHGIWQFMPDTAREYGLRVDWWVDERADPERATRAAAAYLTDLYRQFEDWPLALAAYNCGPGRLRRALDRTGATTFWELLEQAALPKETRGYVPTFFATVLIAGDPAAHGFRLDAPETRDERAVEVEGPLSLRYLADVVAVDEQQLRDLNPSLHRGLVPPGRMPIRVPATAAAAVAEVAATLKQDDATIAVAQFTARKGDTVAKLARHLGTTAETILEMNDLSSPADLRPGRSFYLPVEARKLGTLLRHSEDRAVFYTVQKGDTLYSIAKKYNLTLTDVRELNDLPADTILRPGQKLRVSPPRGLTAGGM